MTSAFALDQFPEALASVRRGGGSRSRWRRVT